MPCGLVNLITMQLPHFIPSISVILQVQNILQVNVTHFNHHEEKLKYFVLHLVRTVSLNFALPREGAGHVDSIVWSLLLAIVDRNVTLLRNTGVVSVRIRKCLGTGF